VTLGHASNLTAPAGPPRLPFALTVGVTGHRLGALADARRAAVQDEIALAFSVLSREPGLLATLSTAPR